MLLTTFACRGQEKDEKAKFSFVQEFDAGGNFRFNEGRMWSFGMQPAVGYEISERLRIGIPIAYYFMLFSHRKNEKMRDLTNGMGICVNFRVDKNQNVELRANIDLTYDNSNRYRQDWFFFKKSASLQVFPLKLASQKIKPFVSLGVKHYRAWMEDKIENKHSTETFLSQYLSFGLVYNY